MVIMGFGFGALLMSKLLAPALESHTDGNLVAMFIWLGVVFTAVTVLAGSRLQNPPPGFPPAGFSPAGFPRQSVDTATEADAGRVEPDRSGAESSLAAEASERDPAPMSQTAHAGKALRSRSFAMMWLIFFCNIIAGIAIIGFQSPLMQDLWRLANASLPPQKVAAFGATLIAVSSVFNGLGRMLWGAISDHIGRIRVFRIMLGTQIAVFGALMITTNPWVFGALVCYVLLCYGGGFGCMPSFVQDTFGEKLMPLVYGCILTAWSAAGLLGPPLLGVMRDHAGVMAARYSFMTGAAFLSVGLIVALFSRWPSGKTVCQ
jgi:OFA family oxalate/formate antiporter-like MFS transporter